ncbi:hypothetical protein EDD11_008471 [Mortierella claussenii]|nr:hypothetical protein EDD11_008471 [Mortierella claussenii]
MRFSVVAIVASVLAVANAYDYPFKANGQCVAKCLLDAGKGMYADFTDDPTNPHFLESLSYAHERGTPKYTTYMTKSGMCLTKCPTGELDLYNQQYGAKNEWYKAAKAAAAAGSTSFAVPSYTGTPASGHGAGGPPTATSSASAIQSPNAASSLVVGSTAAVGAAAAAVFVALL